MTTLATPRVATLKKQPHDPLTKFDTEMQRLQGSLGWASESQYGPRAELSILHAALNLAQNGVALANCTKGVIEPKNAQAASALFSVAAELIWGNSFGIGGGRNPRDKRAAYSATEAMRNLREVLAPYKKQGRKPDAASIEQISRDIRYAAEQGSQVISRLSPQLPTRRTDSLTEKFLGNELNEARSSIVKGIQQAESPQEKGRMYLIKTGFELAKLGVERMDDRYAAGSYFAAARDTFPSFDRTKNAPLFDAIQKLLRLPSVLDGSDEDSPRQIAERQKMVLEVFRDACLKLEYMTH
jgi:hypothetical protein